MNQIHQISPDRRGTAWPGCRLLLGLLISLRPHATAHDLYTNYIQHSIHLTIGDRHVDITLDLTFFEEWSARERQVMDANANGRIARAELEAYLKRLAPELSGPVKLRVAGRELPLAPLYTRKLTCWPTTKPARAITGSACFFSTRRQRPCGRAMRSRLKTASGRRRRFWRQRRWQVVTAAN